jgi:hypothetical protein
MPALSNTAAFDYDGLPADIAAEARAAAERIRGSRETASEAVIAIGRELIAIKQRLDHGQFGRWLKAEFSMTARTANNYMRVAETFGGEKQKPVSTLPADTLFLLAKSTTPDPIRQQVLERAESGERVSAGSVRKEIDRGKVVRLPTRPRHPSRPQTLGARIAAADEAFKLATKAGIDHRPIAAAAVDAATDAVADGIDGGETAGAKVVEAIRTAIGATSRNIITVDITDTDEVMAADIVAQIGFNRAHELARAILRTRAAEVA